MSELGTTHFPGCGDIGGPKHAGCKTTHQIWPGGWMGLRNRIQCLKCQDVIEAYHQHDFKWCKCGAIAIDGGFQGHWRRIGNMEDWREMP